MQADSSHHSKRNQGVIAPAGPPILSALVATLPVLPAIVLSAILFSGCVVIPIADLLKPPRLEERLVKAGGSDKIAILDIDGVISGRASSSLLASQPNTVHEIRSRLERIEEDLRVKAVVLNVSSPGGEVTACDVIYDELVRVKTKRDLPIVATIVDTGASGGYYIASAADTILAHPTAIVGSIGVILQAVNVSGLFEKIGVSVVTIKSGTFKDMLSPFKLEDSGDVDVLDDVVKRLHARFVDIVDRGRPGLERDRVESLADGKVYVAEQALEKGLIDGVGYLTDAIDEAAKRADIEDPTVIRYSRSRSLGQSIYAVNSTPRPRTGISLSLDPEAVPSPRFMYLWVP